jgi:hypothetical protein
MGKREAVYVVFSMGNEDPEAICDLESTAKRLVKELSAQGKDVWHERWTLEEYSHYG